MYTKTIPFKDYNKKPRNIEVQFNLDEREVFKLLTEFKVVFDWQESMKGDARELPTEEVVEFYNAFEEILLSAYGHVIKDGLEFDKSDRYSFQQSALFNACMVMFVTEPAETGKMVSAIMPEGMEDLVRKATENMEALEASEGAEPLPDTAQAELARLRAELAARDQAALATRPEGTPQA